MKESEKFEIKETYKKVLSSIEANTFSGVKDSKKFIEELKAKNNKLN